LGHVSQQAIVAEGERPQADECLGDANARLDRNHACRVVHREVEVGADFQLPGHRPGGCSGLGFQHPASSDVGHHQRIGVLVVAQRTSPLPVEVEHPQTHRAHPEREPEHCPHARFQRWRGEGEPPASHRIRQVGLGYDPVLLVGIQARALAQRVLQVLDQLAHVVGGTQRPAWHITGHEHDTRTSHRRDLREHGAQPGGRQPVSSSAQLGQDPTKPVAWHFRDTGPGKSPACGI
jgi:hypothetical protein